MRSMDFDLILIKREELVSQNQADSLLRKTLCKAGVHDFKKGKGLPIQLCPTLGRDAHLHFLVEGSSIV